jgi:putative membrane protein
MNAGKMTMAIAVAFAFTTGLSARQQPPPQPPQQPTQHPTRPPMTGDKQSAKTDTMSADHTFVKKMAQGGMAEVELGKLAAKNASSPEVKAFGQRMVDDHGKAGDELKTIAEKKSIAWPTSLDAKSQALHDKLATLNGDAFDRAYVKAMLSDHKKDAAELKTESKSGKDPDVKEWAAKTLSTVESHLSEVEKINQSQGPVGTSGKKTTR